MSTLLVITSAELPPYSARGLTQTLEPIPASVNMRRTVNGALTDISDASFRKYQSVISCTDMDTPALDGIWPGMTVTVDCVAELAYRDTTDATPTRTVVSGSSRTADDFVFYRPQLTMKVTAFQTTTDEYGASTGWRLALEEV